MKMKSVSAALIIMSNSTAFCYIMYMTKNTEKQTGIRSNFFNWRNCFLWKNYTKPTPRSYFGGGRYGNN
jgi:hypothetical protein